MKKWHIVPILTYSTRKKRKKKVKDKRCTIVFFFDVFTVVVRCLVL